jgi:serine/threonine-protein kinase
MRDNGTENGDIAAIFCDISACVNKINELHGSKVIQTQALKAERQSLWSMVQELKTKADGYDTDYKLQVWIEIDNMINVNISDFLEVAQPSDIVALLRQIQDGAAAVDNSNPDIQNLVKQLQTSTAETIFRTESAK